MACIYIPQKIKGESRLFFHFQTMVFYVSVSISASSTMDVSICFRVGTWRTFKPKTIFLHNSMLLTWNSIMATMTKKELIVSVVLKREKFNLDNILDISVLIFRLNEILANELNCIYPKN